MTPAHSAHAIEIRRARDEDNPAILALLQDALSREIDPRHAQLFSWKHVENVFGPSPAWLALDRDRVVGFRTFMRWRFETGEQTLGAVRAVDTATDPSYQGRGIFTQLTRRALEELRTEAIEFVFNTPNAQSRPGYEKMGWEVVGRLPIAVRATSARGLLRLSRARAPADQWSEPTRAGSDLALILEGGRLPELLASRPQSDGLRTPISVEYLVWRYGHPWLGYRGFVGTDGIEAGLVIFRIRRRGRAREASVCEVLTPGDDRGLQRRLVGEFTRAVDADYALTLGRRIGGLIPLPGQGPVLLWRGVTVASMPRRPQWHLTLGDIERA
ncbi:MAG: GNAT family N-acetyltransferase [Actinomycetota bacterium]